MDQQPAWTPFVRTGEIVAHPDDGLPDGDIYQNSRYLVIRRECGVAEIGPLIWLSIKSLENDARHDWRDFQRIKNELVGPEAEAVELYPAETRLVDTSNQFHLWCFPQFRLPFGFDERLVSEESPGVTQRRFPQDNRPADLIRVDVRTWRKGGKP